MSSIYYIFFFFLEFRIPNYVLVFIQEWLLQTNNNISKGQDDPSQKADLHSDPVSFHRHWMRPGFFSSHHERLPSQWGPLLWIYVATEDPFNISSGMLYTIQFKEAWELFNSLYRPRKDLFRYGSFLQESYKTTTKWSIDVISELELLNSHSPALIESKIVY